jgi:hypothetical protein
MTSRSWILLLALVVVAIAVLARTMVAKDDNITICHLPPGNPSNPQTITVAQSAVAAHQRHGDTLGPCAVSPSR